MPRQGKIAYIQIVEELKLVFDYVRGTVWADDTPDEVVVHSAQKAFKKLTTGEYSKVKSLYRLAGQSGSGKTTQLLPAILEVERKKGNKPIVLGVRSFVEYYPKYKELLQTVGRADIRERTNGFALKCLAATLKLLIEGGYLIILDMTLLGVEFERFAWGCLRANGYRLEYHIMAVSKELSQSFIEKRTRKGDEGGRIVKQTSQDYFYDILPVALEYLANQDNKSRCFVWTAYDKEPTYIGNLLGGVAALEKGRKTDGSLRFSEEELLNAKMKVIAAS